MWRVKAILRMSEKLINKIFRVTLCDTCLHVLESKIYADELFDSNIFDGFDDINVTTWF